MTAFAGLDMIFKLLKWAIRTAFRFWWHVIRLVFGPIIRHPVIRFALMLVLGFIGIPLALHWAATHTVSIGVATAVSGVTALWWLFMSDLVHHLYPHPALSRIMRIGYPLTAYPLLRSWMRLDWLAAVTVAVVAGLVGIVPYFTNSRSRRGI